MEQFYKVRALAQAGADVTLHYFDYKKGRSAAGLEQLCTRIFKYHRKGISSLISAQPFIVSSRVNTQLIQQLNIDNAPVLLEGVHCTGVIPYLKPTNRNILVRLHNDEACYYQQLSRQEKNPIKRLYYSVESGLLRRYQKQIDKSPTYLALSRSDQETFTRHYHLPHVEFLPSFIPWQKVLCKEESGSYCLYHGNLAINENEQAAIWLIEKVFSGLQIPLVIAGKNPTQFLKQVAGKYPHVQLAESPDESHLQKLILDAHIHLLPSRNNTGVKFKLLNSLLNGRFVVTNPQGAAGSGAESMVKWAHSAEEYKETVLTLMQQPFTTGEKNKRNELLRLYDNSENARKIIEMI